MDNEGLGFEAIGTCRHCGETQVPVKLYKGQYWCLSDIAYDKQIETSKANYRKKQYNDEIMRRGINVSDK